MHHLRESLKVVSVPVHLMDQITYIYYLPTPEPRVS